MTDPITPVLTRRWAEPRSWSIDTYERTGGYQAFRDALRADPDELIQLVKDSGLRGRGGAGFPTGMKWGFIPQGPTGPGAKPKYLVINADEGEPGTCKDIPTMMADPHSLIEGCIITCYAIRAHFCAIYVRGEALHPIRRARQRRARGLREGLPRPRHPRHGLRHRHRRARGRGRLHLRRGDGAARLARRPPRPAPAQAAVPGHRGPLRVAHRGQQRRDDRQRAVHRVGRQRLVPVHGHREEPRPQDLLGLRARRAARPDRGAARHHAARSCWSSAAA